MSAWLNWCRSGLIGGSDNTCHYRAKFYRCKQVARKSEIVIKRFLVAHRIISPKNLFLLQLFN